MTKWQASVAGGRRRIARGAALLTVALAGFAAAALAGIALAKTFTIKVARDAQVMSLGGASKQESIVVNSHGRALYTLSGDTKRHPKCTKASGCFAFWPPAKVSSKNVTKASGIRGKLGVWRRDGFLQLTIAGHPLYTFSQDTRKDVATGQGIRTFGGVWHVRTASGAASSSPSTSTTPPTTTTPPYTTTPYPYP